MAMQATRRGTGRADRSTGVELRHPKGRAPSASTAMAFGGQDFSIQGKC